MTSVIDHWDIARFVLGVLIVACNFGVWRGVALEQSLAESDKNFGRKLLVRSLALELCLAMVLLVVDTVGSVSQKREIVALNTEIAPRRLNREQGEVITRALTAFGGKNVQLESYGLDVEAAVLGRQLKEAMEAASIGVGDALMTRASSGSVVFGVHVIGQNGDLVRALIMALLKADVDAAEGDVLAGGSTSSGVQSAGPPAIDAYVFIGVKPIRR